MPAAHPRKEYAHAPMGIALTTPDGVLVDANPALCAMLAPPPKELYGRSLLRHLHPEAVGAAREAHASLIAVPTRPMRHETRLQPADGTDLPVQITASWVAETADGQAAHLVMIVEDITERK